MIKIVGDLVVTRGKALSLLGMNINITKEKIIEIYMKEQLREVIEKFGEKITGEIFLTGKSSSCYCKRRREIIEFRKKAIFPTQ